MARNFLMVSQQELNIKIAENIRSREMELASYDFEKEHHEQAIAALGDIQWNEATEKYKGLARDVMIARAIADGLDSVTIQTISDLNSLDSHKANLEAVIIETSKSERTYENLVASLPEGNDRDAAFAAVIAKGE
jgi:hypothetical protein